MYLWTETAGTGHAFVSVHVNNVVYLYSYGRYGRTDPGDFTGDGILNFFVGIDAHQYYVHQLYNLKAKVFRINDADAGLTRRFYENLWHKATPAVPTASMKDCTRRRGRTIDKYDVTGNNCTTLCVAGIRAAGSAMFDACPRLLAKRPGIARRQDFTIPLSLQRFLVSKSAMPPPALCDEVTQAFMHYYPYRMNAGEFSAVRGGFLHQAVAASSAAVGLFTGYSGANVGGFLGKMALLTKNYWFTGLRIIIFGSLYYLALFYSECFFG